MLHQLKRQLYFVVAGYFGFWAKFVLRRWQPRIVVITGSSGKTTVLHLVEAQLGDQAVYGHHANSAIGIPFHVLGFEPNVTSKLDYLVRLVVAPFKAWRSVPTTKLYIVEADCDRPHEGEFLSKLLKPEVTLWISVSNTHSMNFDGLVQAGRFQTQLQAIAYEFGNFIAQTSQLVLLNDDQPAIITQIKRVPPGVTIKKYSINQISRYSLTANGTTFEINGQNISLMGLHPKEVSVSLQMIHELLAYLSMPLDLAYTQLRLPPGRSAVFAGKHNTTLIDSTYNTGLGASEAVLNLLAAYPSKHKWLVMGDILEQADVEQYEHERLAQMIGDLDVERVMLLGPRVMQYTYPILQAKKKPLVVAFENAGDGLKYLQENLKGGETIVFKGARGMEGIIEQLLANPADTDKLVRRGAVWTKRRQAWGLPQ